MSDENKGSDLDIFEGLGKKSAAPVSAVPPPPPSGGHRASIPAPAPELKKTLLGIPGPAMGSVPVPAATPSRPPPLPPGHASQPPAAAAPPARPSSPPVPAARPSAPPLPSARPSAAPGAQTLESARPQLAPSRVPPPPSRSQLPAVTPPPSQSSMPATARATSVRPAGGSVPPAPVTQPTNGRKIQMEWDDDQEATHVFDKDTKGTSTGEVTTVAAVPAEVAASKRPSQAPVLSVPSATSNAPPPAPSSLSGAFAQLGTPSPSAPPPPSATLRGSGAPPPPPGGRASAAPPPPPPGQTTTAPMHMPPRVSAPPPPPHVAHPASVPPASMPPVSAPPPSLQMPPVSRSMEETAMVPRQQSKAGLWIALVAAAVAIAGAIAFFMMPRTATLAVNVADTTGKEVSKLEVFVDDTKQSCESAPCIVRDLAAGVHSVKVKADGYESLAPRAVTVAGGKDDTLSFTLAKAGGGAGTGIKVSGLQPGVRLFVDGKDVGALPQDLKDLTPGDHTLKIAGSDRYEPLEKTVTVKAGEMTDLGNVALKVLKGKVTFEAGTPGAKAHLEAGTNKRALPYLPIAIDFDPKEHWELVATAPGFDELRRPISFDDGLAEKTISVTLSPKGAAPAPQAVAAAQPAAPTPKAATPAAAPAPAAAPKPAPAAAAGEAFLTLNSLPASNVVLDGKPLGMTPKLKVPVSAGAHTVLFVNAEQSLKKSMSVTVAAGETKPVIAKLRD